MTSQTALSRYPTPPPLPPCRGNLWRDLVDLLRTFEFSKVFLAKGSPKSILVMHFFSNNYIYFPFLMYHCLYTITFNCPLNLL